MLNQLSIYNINTFFSNPIKLIELDNNHNFNKLNRMNNNKFLKLIFN